jgi:RimJ/RimL family protein N-acetyltransferase
MHHRAEVIPFLPGHLDEIDVQDEQKYIFKHLEDTGISRLQYGYILVDGAIIEKDGCPCAWSYIVNGKVVGCGGIITTGLDHMAEAWCIFGKDFKSAARIAVKRILRAVQECNYDRVQAVTEVDFKVAQRFLKWLGFEEEGILRCSGADKRDNIIYSIIRGK